MSDPPVPVAARGTPEAGLSGLLLWGRGRSLRQMIFSIAGVALLGLLLIGGAACGIIGR